MTAFHNKSVLVLGGSRGIGAAIVRRFVADGASVRFSYSGSPEAAERLAAETGSTAVRSRPWRASSRRSAPMSATDTAADVPVEAPGGAAEWMLI